MSERCKPPPLPGGEEGVAYMQKFGGLLLCSHSVAYRQWCQCRACVRVEGAWWGILTCPAGDVVLHVFGNITHRDYLYLYVLSPQREILQYTHLHLVLIHTEVTGNEVDDSWLCRVK